MQNTFYDRLDFYRMLNTGMNNLAEMAYALKVSTRTLQRWKQDYDPERGPFGSIGDISVPVGGDPQHETSEEIDGQAHLADIVGARRKKITREDIMDAVRQSALDGNIQAAKLLLSEYDTSDGDEVLTVDRALQLLDEWSKKGEL